MRELLKMFESNRLHICTSGASYAAIPKIAKFHFSTIYFSEYTREISRPGTGSSQHSRIPNGSPANPPPTCSMHTAHFDPWVPVST